VALVPRFPPHYKALRALPKAHGAAIPMYRDRRSQSAKRHFFYRHRSKKCPDKSGLGYGDKNVAAPCACGGYDTC
jgi:hypothetical protein